MPGWGKGAGRESSFENNKGGNPPISDSKADSLAIPAETGERRSPTICEVTLVPIPGLPTITSLAVKMLF